SLEDLFNKAEAGFPSRFRKYSWYLAVVRAILAPILYYLSGLYARRLLLQPVPRVGQTARQYAAVSLVRRLREVLVKYIIINRIPVVIEAIMSIVDIEKPKDYNYSYLRQVRIIYR
ncbi:hypothetical protein B0T18DRAFT_326277, partial [Schizothecium vesticola]